MVIYLDLVFLANFAADVLALFLTAKLSALPVKVKKVLIAAFLGAFYGTLYYVPSFSLLSHFTLQVIVALLLTYIVFGKIKVFLRVLSIYYLLSFLLGGAIFAFSQTIATDGVMKTLQTINWKVFLLVGGVCYFAMTFLFKGSLKHAVSGEILQGKVLLNGHTSKLSILFDTGHTLQDPYTGGPVLTVWYRSLLSLFSEEERNVLENIETCGCVDCLQLLSKISPGKFFLLPYRAVGVDSSVLFSFRADSVVIAGEKIPSVLIALSPTPLSDGGGYVALWGGIRKEDLSIDIQNCADAASIAR